MVTLLLLLPALHSQNTADSLQRHSSTQMEGLLLRGSSYISLNSSLPLQPGSLLGFSFRSCHSGQLVRQGDSQSSVTLTLRGGVLQLQLRAGGESRTEQVGAGLTDGAWHTVRLSVAPGQDRICLSVDTDMECEPPSSGPRVMNSLEERSNVRRMDNMRDFLASLDTPTASPGVTVGTGLVACIREGPGLRFTSGAIRDKVGVSWGSCLLPHTCQGYDWEGASSLTSSPSSCGGEAGCQNGGVCFPRTGGQAPACVCPPGYSGASCTELATSCQESPCLHGGNCSDSSDGYVCGCEDTGYSGQNCHLEDNSCAGQTCSNGATCLDQPGSFLCQCTAGFTGRTCEARLDSCHCSNGGTCQPGGPCSCPPGYSGPRCEEEAACLGVECPEHSVCGLLAGQPTCQCGPGYSGDPSTGCVRQSLCSPEPCQNGGTCTENSSSFNCSCPVGYQGHLCQDDIPECDTQPCLNNGTCIELPGSFSCSCQPGYQGRTCQTDVDECLDNPCGGQGNCVNTAGSYQCECNSGWGGQHCEISLVQCRTNPCSNGATCVDQDDGYRCECPAGFGGAQCEEVTDECAATRPCQNGASCVSENNSYKCHCSPRFMGDNCELRYDPCLGSPCQNGACIPLREERTAEEDFRCECSEGYTGPTCAENIDDCLGQTECGPGQHCVDLVNTYKCCPRGYRGPQCEENINECESNPCQNEGRCIDGVAEYTCDCPEGWTGRDCSEDVDECQTPNICNYGVCYNNEGGFQCYCRPGYSGNTCDFDFNECLSNPCLNNGTCDNRVNSYSCTCVPGFNGTDCEFNIDDCVGNPCQNEATCEDGVNTYTCHCKPGYDGENCEVDIDDCESTPCLNGGQCDDGVNMFTCNCDDTGFTGLTCELDIDECEVEPCQHNSTCHNEINDYSCHCWPGYTGKNCSEDIQDCQDSPCKNNATCYEHSNVSLYARPEDLPAEIKPYFLEGFSYNKAAGRQCLCPTGFNGTDCGNNIDDCQGDPCQNEASCEDGVASYTCHCKPGYEGENCEIQIDECERYQPCQNNARCKDLTADYSCLCAPEFGGKNCSVPLTGCQEVECLNEGVCTPWLIGETDHRANCSCTPGYTGDTCQIQTTFSFKGDSYISVMSDRYEGYELELRFRTTLSNGTLAIGQGQGQGFFKLELLEGRLKVYSGMLRLEEGVTIGDNLNDTTWQKAFLAVNSSHLTIGLNDRYQRIDPIYPDDLSQTAFNMTSLGGRPETDTIIPSTEFVGCIQDISVNGIKVREDLTSSQGIIKRNTDVGCDRSDQCNPNPCENEGFCIDLWRRKECRCKRPYLGPTCQYTYTGATFGHENITESQAVVTISNPKSYKDNIDLTMFIRTKQKNGFVFYLGKSDLNSTIKNNIIGRLVDGTLQVETSINELDKVEPFILFSEQLSDGNRHFIHVKRMSKEITVSINESTSLVQELSSIVPIQAEKLYLGNLIMKDEESRQPPPATVRTTTTTTVTTTSSTTTLATTTREELETTQSTVEIIEDITTAVAEPLLLSRQQREVDDEVHAENIFFKGVIQDVRLGNGKTTSIVNLFNLTTEIARELTETKIPSLGVVKTYHLMEGEVSDDTCRDGPCQNDGECRITWNDYVCECPAGFKGANCEEIEYCFSSPCPETSQCNTLSDGFECVSNLTLNGVNTSLSYSPKLSEDVKIDSIKLMFRTLSSGTLMQLVNSDGQNISFNINNGRFEIIARTAVGTVGENFTFGHDIDDGSWHMIVLQLIDKSLGFLDNGTGDEELLEENSIFNNLTGFINSSKIILGSSIRAEDSSPTNHFRGCLNEIRIAEILLPYFTDADVINQTTQERFVLEEQDDLTRGECVLCYQEECMNQGQCYDPAEEFDCRCPYGFEGPTCAENIICKNNSCDHGQCVEGFGNYTCNCELGWIGWLCDEDKDECEDAPCQNGGTCTETVQPGSYTCQCGEAYKGLNCEEEKIKNCGHFPCQNGGTCVPRNNSSSSNKYSCDCAQGYEGYNCDQQIDYCRELNKNCLNGGTCRSLFSSFSAECLCQPGYAGDNCETDIDDCAEVPCKNGGVCTDKVNGFQCDCAGSGFMGRTCQENIDECAVEAPCHHGRCNDTIGDYQCLCEESYCGKNCNVKDPCLLNGTLCRNEGTCRPACDTDIGFICDCSTGWEGVNCHLKILHIPKSLPPDLDEEWTSLIIAPVAGGMLFVALVGLIVFFNMARRKRSQHGTYNPHKQEVMAPRLELNYLLKPPPEERLI